jgi:Leucine-rich repeat (LRR) protein
MSPKPHRRWMQFSLRTLLVVVTLTSFLLGYVAWEREQCRQGQQSLNKLEQLMTSSANKVEKVSSTRPGWLKVLLGNDAFRGVKSVELRDTSLSDSDLHPLAAFPNLHSVRMEAPNVTDAGISQLRGLKAAEQFHFVRNRRVAGKCWEVMDGWRQLRSLSFADSDFCDGETPDFSALTNLKELDLSQSNINSPGAKCSLLPASLEVLNLSVTQTTDADLEQLGQLVKMRSLDLSSTYVRGMGLANLPAPLELYTLNLNAANISDVELASIARFTRLRQLQLNSTLISDAGLGRLAELTRLESLDISYNRISNKGLLHLRGLTNLKTLLLDYTLATGAGVDELQRALPNTKISRDRIRTD